MLKHYTIELKSTQENNKIKSNFAYYLYAILLENCPNSFATEIHNTGFTPISHKLLIKDDKILWKVTLFNDAISILGDVLLNKKEWFIKKENIVLSTVDVQCTTITADDLFKYKYDSIKLNFVTTTAFKSQDIIHNIPSNHFIFQSLFKKWNMAFPEAIIEDDDQEGIETIARHMIIKNFILKDSTYRLKGQSIKGFQGNLLLTPHNKMDNFHKELAFALLLFSEYSGIGIKTAMGMGGITVTK